MPQNLKDQKAEVEAFAKAPTCVEKQFIFFVGLRPRTPHFFDLLEV